MAFLEITSIVYAILLGLTTNVTGSWFYTYLLIIFFFMVFFSLFRVPIEFTSIAIFPLIVVILSYNSDFLGVAGAFAIYIAIIIAKNFLLARNY